MNIENIYSDWGSLVRLDTPQEFFDQPTEFWRDLIYERKLIILKQVNFIKAEYVEFGLRFGSLWSADNYIYSREKVEPVETTHGTMTISPFSNRTNKVITDNEMPWHADIPNRSYKPFPFRSLWITEQVNPETSGKTIWLNLEKAITYLSPEMEELLPRVRIVQQSWYEQGKDIQEFDLLKIHPITGAKSLRLNYYNWGKKITNAWILDVKIDGVSQGHCFLIRQWLQYLVQFKELLYRHTWDLYDIALYDNWSFVHGRSALRFDTTSDTRHFYRLNIDHLDTNEWIEHKNKFGLNK
jgi:alpha-ketoglutarate-dependent taurine dioxygenase